MTYIGFSLAGQILTSPAAPLTLAARGALGTWEGQEESCGGWGTRGTVNSQSVGYL